MSGKKAKMATGVAILMAMAIAGCGGGGGSSDGSSGGGGFGTPLPISPNEWGGFNGNGWNTQTPGTGVPPPPSGGGGGGGGGGGNGDEITYPNGHPISTATTDATILGVEDEILTLVNNHRASIGVGSLQMHEGLRKCARAHSKHMGPVHDFFAHTNPEGDGPGERITKCNVSYQAAGENIAAGYGSAQQAFNGWMNSPGHKANIENSLWTHTGIGYWTGGSYGKYYTQVFTKQ